MVLVCACAITLHNDYFKDDIGNHGRLKFYCIISMAIITFHLCIAGIRFRKYFDQGDRLAIITLINFVVAQLFLVYSLICSIATLKKTKQRRPLRNQPTTV